MLRIVPTLLLAVAAPLFSGDPNHYATFSICAIDSATGESGVAVTTRVPFVGRAVPWVRAGVGAAATQAFTVVEYGPKALDLIAQGIEPSVAIDKLLEGDASKERRQLGLIDMKGRGAAFTGKENGTFAGSRQGKNFTVQGNILTGVEVLEAVAKQFESTEGTGMALAERLILALEAGHLQGGDKRWGSFQSAALRIANPKDPGRAGDYISVAIDVGEHQDPVAELKRIYYSTGRRLGYRTFSAVRGPDVVELKRMLHALGYWKKDFAEIPEAPAFTADRALMRTDPKKYQELFDEYRKKASEYDEKYAVYDQETIDAVDAFRKTHGLDYEGTPAGLVDERLVAKLREKYFRKARS